MTTIHRFTLQDGTELDAQSFSADPDDRTLLLVTTRDELVAIYADQVFAVTTTTREDSSSAF